MTNPTIGFIGLGLMGHGMAKSIREVGYPLSVMAHRKRAAIEELIEPGAAIEAAGEGERYVPMLADFVARTNGLETE